MQGQQLAQQQSPSAQSAQFGGGTAAAATILPQLYFPEAIGQLRQHLAGRTVEFLAPFGDQLPLLGLKTLLRDTFGLPSSLAYPLLAKLAPGSDNLISIASLQSWLVSNDFMGHGQAQRTFDILRASESDGVVPFDFRPLLSGILGSHPGLAFLHDAPEFQERYAETVVHRIFYSMNGNCSGKLSLRDIKR